MYDVAVIGAGVIGSATAYHIAKSGVKVVLIEQVQRNWIKSRCMLYFNSLVQVIQEVVPMAAHGSPDISTIRNTTLE